MRVGKCYHEAAHAVFAHYAGLKIYDIAAATVPSKNLTLRIHPPLRLVSA